MLAEEALQSAAHGMALGPLPEASVQARADEPGSRRRLDRSCLLLGSRGHDGDGQDQRHQGSGAVVILHGPIIKPRWPSDKGRILARTLPF